MKKFIALCLAIVMCVSLFAACNTKTPPEETTAPKVEQKPIMEAPTVKTLSEKTGIPLAPATDKQ